MVHTDMCETMLGCL